MYGKKMNGTGKLERPILLNCTHENGNAFCGLVAVWLERHLTLVQRSGGVQAQLSSHVHVLDRYGQYLEKGSCSYGR